MTIYPAASELHPLLPTPSQPRHKDTDLFNSNYDPTPSRVHGSVPFTAMRSSNRAPTSNCGSSTDSMANIAQSASILARRYRGGKYRRGCACVFLRSLENPRGVKSKAENGEEGKVCTLRRVMNAVYLCI